MMKAGMTEQTIRQMPDSVLSAMQFVADAPAQPALCLEHNGRGETYYTLRFYAMRRAGRPAKQRSVYVGRMTEKDAAHMQSWIALCWMSHDSRPRWNDHAKQIRHNRKERLAVMTLARQAASQCGYQFRGNELRHLPGRTQSATASKREVDALEDLSFHILMAWNCNLGVRAAVHDQLYLLLSRPWAKTRYATEKAYEAGIRRVVQSMAVAGRINAKLTHAQEKIKARRAQLGVAA
jgi:hypothetical protein